MDESQPVDAPLGPHERRVFSIVGPRRVWVSPAIVGANVLVFVAMLAGGVSFLRPTSDELLRWGADHGPLVASGEWWRLLSNAFVHVGILHIALNMWVFRSLGRAVERLFGNGAFLLLYLASALGASIASILWNPSVISAGASGAIFGVAGAFLAFFLGHRKAMPVELFSTMTKSLLSFVVINALFGLMVPGIDNAAHLGGLFTGFIAGVVLNRAVETPPVLGRARLVRAAILFAGLIALASLIPWRVGDRAAGNGLYAASAGRAMRSKDWDEVVRIADEWIAQDPKDGEAWQVRATGRLARGDERGSRSDLDHALGLRDDLPYAYGTRADLRLQDGNVAGALRDYDKLIELLPGEAWCSEARAHARYAALDWTGALRDFQVAIGLEPRESGEARLYAWLLRSRLSMRDAAMRDAANDDLRLSVESARDGGWETHQLRLASFLLGDLSEHQLVAAVPASHQRQAFYFRAVKSLLDGDRAKAQELFERCLASRDVDVNAWMHAHTELDLLAK